MEDNMCIDVKFILYDNAEHPTDALLEQHKNGRKNA
jgi:hypothetical protein